MQLEYRTANWIANLLQEAPTDFDEWIEDGRVLCRAINKIIFNAVPNDIINAPNNDVKVCEVLANSVHSKCNNDYVDYVKKYMLQP